MNLFRLYAFAVSPQRTTPEDEFEAPSGGAIGFDATLSAALDEALNHATREQPTRVNLQVNLDGSRASELRDNVMAFLWAGSNAAAGGPADQLAARLSRAMDMRSQPCLFLAAGYRVSASNPERQMALWMFPRDRAFRFESARNRIDLIEDAFSRTSKQRKLALAKGRNVRGQFHDWDVLDFQSRGRAGRVADFWMDYFLEALPAITDDAGSQILAEIFRGTSAHVTDPAGLDQLQAAVMQLRAGPVQRRSIDTIGDDYLDGEALRVFKENARSALPDAARRTAFQLNREEFSTKLKVRAFRTKEGTQVIAPLGTIGDSVRIDVRNTAQGQEEYVVVEDVVVEDRMR